MSRRKFGSSFIVEMTVRFGPCFGPPTEGAAVSSRGREAAPADATGRARCVVFLRDDPALARGVGVFTYADPPVAGLAVSGPAATRPVQAEQHYQSAAPAD